MNKKESYDPYDAENSLLVFDGSQNHVEWLNRRFKLLVRMATLKAAAHEAEASGDPMTSILHADIAETMALLEAGRAEAARIVGVMDQRAAARGDAS